MSDNINGIPTSPSSPSLPTFEKMIMSEEFLKANMGRLKELVRLGMLDDNWNLNTVRNYNVGESDYSNGNHLIQPWTLWLDWNHLTSWDHDMIKRIYRTKEIQGKSYNESRIEDYEKIKHDCDERIRQLKWQVR